ncbi:MAG: EAL domain-containing protein [Gammaproteobacteria bacterium]|nr:EAL domain-containing protein [Gammaproteobacteria bacterium]
MKTNNYHGYLQRRLLIPLAVVIATTAVAFASVIAWHVNSGISSDAQMHSRIASAVYQSSIENDVNMMLPILSMLQRDESIREAFIHRDRDALLRLSASLYEQLNRNHHITHFYFTTPDRINLLRVHNPTRFGDRIERHTTLMAEQRGQPSHGLEMGVMGTFTLRVVMPWYHQGELIGYLELGEEIDHIINRLRQLLQLDIYLFIRKSLLDPEKSGELAQLTGHRLNWERYPGYLLLARDETTLPMTLERILKDGRRIVFDHQINITTADHDYKATFLPLHDVSDEQAGMLLLLDRTTHWWQAGGKTLALTALLLAVVPGSVFIFFLRLARATEQTLQEKQRQLLEEHARIKESNRILTQTEEHLRLSRDRLSKAQRIARLGSWEWDIDDNRFYCSDEVYSILGLTKGGTPLSYETFRDATAGNRSQLLDHEIQREMQQALQNGGNYIMEHAIRHPDRSERLVQERGEVMVAHGRPVRVAGTLHDITEQRHNEQHMERLGQILDHASNEIYLIAADTLAILQANHTAAMQLGYSGDELTSRGYLEIATELTDDQLRRLAAPLSLNSGQEINFETHHTCKEGERYPVEVRLQLSQIAGRAIYIALALDIGERLARQREIYHHETHDRLTTLPNRLHLLTELEQEIARAQRFSNPLLLAQFNINKLGEINDTLGHDNGDLILQQFAQRLQLSIRETDTVARLGGDEFCLLLPGAGIDDCDAVIAKIIQPLSTPFATASFSLNIEYSVGLAVYPNHATSAGELLQHGDIALRRARKFGSGIELYRPEIDGSNVRHLILGSHLRNAITQGELQLYYQPKVEGSSGHVTEAEALLRWNHPEHGMISPAEFIPIAERTGYIKQLTRWVIREAAQQQAQWRTAGPRLRVAVNLSAHNLLDPDLFNYILQQVQQSGIPHGCLSFEVTESAAMIDPDYTIATLNELSSLGHRIAIDDYGTGYSSLAYLQRLPADELKIDSSFIFRMLEDEESATIVRSTIMLGHNLGKSVTAEGVESAALVTALLALKCDMLQGYHYSKPLPAGEFSTWLSARQNMPRQISAR